MALGSDAAERGGIVNISSEIILGFLTVAGGILSGAVAKIWLWMTAELNECKTERKELYARTETMHGQIMAVTVTVAELKNKLEDQE
jgi:hypothetical protein